MSGPAYGQECRVDMQASGRTSLRKMMERLRESASHTMCAPHPFLSVRKYGNTVSPLTNEGTCAR